MPTVSRLWPSRPSQPANWRCASSLGGNSFYYERTWTGSGDTDSVSGDPCCEKYGRAKNCRKADRAASSGNTGSAFPGTEAFWSGGAGCLSGSPDCTCEFQQGRTDGKIIKIYTRRNIKELWPWDTALLFVLIQGKTGSACFILVP